MIPGEWRVLADGDRERLREAAWAFLDQTGFVVQHAGLLRAARAAGARVDPSDGRVRVPRALAGELMQLVPPRYTIRNLLGQTWEVGGGGPLGLAIVTDPWVIDYATQQPRRPCLEDVRRHTIVAAQLDSVAAISCMDYPVSDVAGPTSALRALEMHLLHHARHYVVMPASADRLRAWLDLARLLAGGDDLRGLLTVAVASGSPVHVNEVNGELLMLAVQHGLAIQPTVCPMAGSTAPYSLAGTLLQSHLEVLMITLLAQMARPANPVLYASGLSVADLRTAADLYYTLDKVLWKIASVQLAKAERMPAMAECGGTMTHRCDVQAGAEGMLFMLAAQASGADLLSGLGSCHNAVGMSAEMMVIQQAFLRGAGHLARGIRIDDRRLALESLRRAGPGSHHLEDELTLALMRSDEFFQDPVFDLSGGHGAGRSMLERAHERVEALVAGFKNPVPEAIREAVQRHVHDRCVGSAGPP
jgi:trimethylamine--corrinoid protein Co-methyltransferase